MLRTAVCTLTVVAALAMCASMPTAHADGLANCNESDGELHADAQQAIDRISAAGVQLGPYEDSSTVLFFVASSLKGIEAKQDCAPIIAGYARFRIEGLMRAPIGPGLD
ncbi:hypothetical protein [Mycobacterium europaeum]|uniref:hypothetical protein n=1 Tax=Mycobacterium europaeum TaxID=761804 RepID=UPI001146A3B2|nr:hypothetical protein [Mycobacterium europaeum]